MNKPSVPPIRSLLFVPGHLETSVEEAHTLGSDAVVIDIEEPRTPFSESERASVRTHVGDYLASLAPDVPTRMFVRVQSVASGFMLRDLLAVLRGPIAGVLLPKIQGANDVIAADAILTCAEAETGREQGSTLIYPILETALSVRNAFDIASASPRVTYMGGAISRFGDIHQSLGYRWTPEADETFHLRSKALLDCRAAGIRYPISGMWGGKVDDLDGMRRWAVSLRNLGYYGMMLETPKHLDLTHEIFSPTEDELRYWQDLDRLATEAENGDGAPILYGDPNDGEGHIVHLAHVGSARQNLEWARQLGMVES
ncbi:MAG: aldolase/citrate lyase family protein [Ilumatobacteraceae bacterium]|nr:aldolase/citrate lyase family protein [Ilumatobacteraceae bacterium]